LALAYERVGDVQGGPDTISLGHFDQALDSYQRSRGILERIVGKSPLNRDALLRLSGLYYKIGQIEVDTRRRVDALASYRAGVALTEQLRSSGGPVDFLLYKGYYRIAMLRVNDEDTEGALESMQQAWKAAEAWAHRENSFKSLEALEQTDRSLAAFLKNRGDVDGSAQRGADAVRIASSLREKNPKDPNATIDLIWSYVGPVIVSPLPADLVGRIDPGTLTKARELAEEVFKNDQKSQIARFTLSLAYLLHGWTMPETGNSDAIVEIQKGGELIARLEAEAPQYNLYHQVQSLEAFELAERAKPGPGADPRILENLERAARILKACWQSDPDDTLSPLLLIDALRKTAEFRQAGGRPRLAQSALKEAIELADRMWTKHPHDLRMAAAQASTYETAGWVAREAGDFNLAAGWYSKSAALWKDWPNRGISSDYDRNHLRKAMTAVAAFKKL
jgi:tetratricopeptide (TPR) repeat protein